jgi:hypothetical protein
MADEHTWVGKNGEIIKIWKKKNEEFREKPEPTHLFPPQVSQPLTWNSKIFRQLLQILTYKSAHHTPFSNLTYSNPCDSNYKHNHHLLISMCQHKSQDVKLYCCQCEALSQHRRQTPSNKSTICYLTYHRFLITISSKKGNTTAAQIMT